MELSKEQKMSIPAEAEPATPSLIESVPSKITRWSYLMDYFTSRNGWVGDYVCSNPCWNKGQIR
jgi:hypothetical protein